MGLMFPISRSDIPYVIACIVFSVTLFAAGRYSAPSAPPPKECPAPVVQAPEEPKTLEELHIPPPPPPTVNVTPTEVIPSSYLTPSAVIPPARKKQHPMVPPLPVELEEEPAEKLPENPYLKSDP